MKTKESLEKLFEKETGIEVSSNYIDPEYMTWLEEKLTNIIVASKPIFFIKLPAHYTDEQVQIISNNLNKNIGQDYYILIAPGINIDNIEIEVFYPKGLEQKNYEELKEIIENSVKK